MPTLLYFPNLPVNDPRPPTFYGDPGYEADVFESLYVYMVVSDRLHWFVRILYISEFRAALSNRYILQLDYNGNRVVLEPHRPPSQAPRIRGPTLRRNSTDGEDV